MTYDPKPIASDEPLPSELLALSEQLSENAHALWASGRIRDGWRYGPSLDAGARTHPSLVPYAELPETEKEIDRRTARGTLRAMLALGYRIVPPPSQAV